jgi:hypothetical protein
MLTAGATASGRLSHELIANVKAKYSYHSYKAIRAIWKKYKAQIMAGDGFRIQRKQGSGRKLKHSADSLAKKIRAIPLYQRKTLRSLSHYVQVPKSTLHDYVRSGILKRATSSIKPHICK